MELPVIIVPLPNAGGFVARLAALDLSAAAPSADEAQARLAGMLSERLRDGLEIRSLKVPSATAPAGWLPDDELTQEWIQHIQDYRAECDARERQEMEQGNDIGEIAK